VFVAAPPQTVDGAPVPSGVTAWQPGAGYATGQQATYDGRTYVCRQGHVAAANWTPPDAPALWLAVADPSDDSWQPDVGYATGQQVTYGGRSYRRVQAHTAQPDWPPPAVPALWQPVD
jgi:hypothetical protein